MVSTECGRGRSVIQPFSLESLLFGICSLSLLKRPTNGTLTTAYRKRVREPRHSDRDQLEYKDRPRAVHVFYTLTSLVQLGYNLPSRNRTDARDPLMMFSLRINLVFHRLPK